MYFVIRAKIKSRENDSLIPIEYFLYDDICELSSIFPSPVGARENISNGQNVSSYHLSNHRMRHL